MNLIKRTALILALVSAPYFIDSVYAQLPPTAGTTGPSGCWPPSTCVPIDGGLSLLIAAGIGLAGKKAYDFSKDGHEE